MPIYLGKRIRHSLFSSQRRGFWVRGTILQAQFFSFDGNQIGIWRVCHQSVRFFFQAVINQHFKPLTDITKCLNWLVLIVEIFLTFLLNPRYLRLFRLFENIPCSKHALNNLNIDFDSMKPLVISNFSVKSLKRPFFKVFMTLYTSSLELGNRM